MHALSLLELVDHTTNCLDDRQRNQDLPWHGMDAYLLFSIRTKASIAQGTMTALLATEK
jgi:hypothetical protein